MINIILKNIPQDDLIKSLHILVYTMYQKKPFDENDLSFLNSLIRKLNIATEYDEIFHIDVRYPLDYNYEFSNMDLSATKGLLFLLTVVSQIDKERNFDKDIKTILKDSFPFESEIQDQVYKLSTSFVDRSIELYNTIFDINKGWFGSTTSEKIPDFEKLFMLPEKAIEVLDYEEKEVFMQLLVYLMFDDDKINDDELFFIELWINILGLDYAFIDTLHTYSDISFLTIEKLQTPWLIRFLILAYLMSQDINKNDISRLNSLIKLKDEKEINLQKFTDQVLLYRKNEIELLNIINTNKCEPNDSACNTTILENIFDFKHNRHKNSSQYDLVDIHTVEDSNIIVICIDGFLTEGDTEQFDDWKENLNIYGSIQTIKGFKWPSHNKGLLLNNAKDGIAIGGRFGIPGVVAGAVSGIVLSWQNAKIKSERAAASLLNHLEAIKAVKPNAKIVLMGHSLGSRVIYNLLQKMGDVNFKIHEVYLFGGAVSATNKTGWMNALQAVDRKIFNFYSANDEILSWFYKNIELREAPIGLDSIEYYRFKGIQLAELENIDSTKIISGHRKYINNLQTLLQGLDNNSVFQKHKL